VLPGIHPWQVRLLVVFMAGLSFLAYLFAKVIFPATAIRVTGAIGGCISPNLAVMSLAEQMRRHPESAIVSALAAAIASTLLFPRMVVIIGILNQIVRPRGVPHRSRITMTRHSVSWSPTVVQNVSLLMIFPSPVL